MLHLGCKKFNKRCGNYSSKLRNHFTTVVDNEWKTRFETQQEMNNQLEKQVVLLRDKLGQLKIPSRDGKLIIFH